MPAIPFAASAAPLSWTPPSVAALKPAVCIAAKSVEVYRKTPRVPELGPDGRLGGGAGLGDGDELGVGAELDVGVGGVAEQSDAVSLLQPAERSVLSSIVGRGTVRRADDERKHLLG